MKTIPSMLQGIALVALASCASQPGQQVNPVASQSSAGLSDKLYQEVNEYRSANGAQSLQRHAGLDRLAREHCEYLRANRGTFDLYGKNVSHNGDSGRSLVAMKSLNMLNSSENVASTMKGASDAQTAGSLVTLWDRSKGHNYAMGNTAWTHTGVGTVTDADGRVFATQLFGTINLSQMASRQRFSGF